MRTQQGHVAQLVGVEALLAPELALRLDPAPHAQAPPWRPARRCSRQRLHLDLRGRPRQRPGLHAVRARSQAVAGYMNRRSCFHAILLH